jgi:hypothetical protein
MDSGQKAGSASPTVLSSLVRSYTLRGEKGRKKGEEINNRCKVDEDEIS